MKVKHAMTKEVVTAHATDSIHSVVTKMVAKHCGVIPVVDSDGFLVGVLSLRDILMPMFASQEDVFHEDVHAMNFEEMEEKYPEVLKLKVEDIMTRNPLSVNPEYPLLRAATTMGLKHLRRIPVTENRKLCGVISVGDINRALYIAYEEDVSKAVNY